jgi:hypothetical protein
MMWASLKGHHGQIIWGTRFQHLKGVNRADGREKHNQILHYLNAKYFQTCSITSYPSSRQDLFASITQFYLLLLKKPR